jgi:hypothetical protein
MYYVLHKRRFLMFECSCGKKYKYASGLNNHKEKCAGAGAGEGGAAGQGGAGASASASAAASGGTVNFTKDDLEALEKRKQARLNTILEAQKKEKEKKLAQDTAAAIQAQAKAIVTAAAAAASANKNANGGANGGNTVVTNNTSNVGNEEHNASFNIKYVKRSEETQQVVRAVTAAAHEYCKGRIIVTSDEPAPGGGALSGISTSVNENGTTVYNHPTRTISIIETPPEEVSPEEEHDITLEKMTYLILSLIQNNNKLTKENQILRSIVARIDPASFE